MVYMSLQEDDAYSSVNHIISFLSVEFERIFGEAMLSHKTCRVVNDSNAECPHYCVLPSPVITLHVNGFTHWCQVIFQLSHEMCHFFIWQGSGYKMAHLRWFEEIICEAFALYCLQYTAEHWSACALSAINPTFDNAIRQYLADEKKGIGTDGFDRITTLDELRLYEANRTAENERSDHYDYVQQVYSMMCKNPTKILGLCFYAFFTVPPDNLVIDFKLWYRLTKNPIVKVLGNVIHLDKRKYLKMAKGGPK